MRNVAEYAPRNSSAAPLGYLSGYVYSEIKFKDIATVAPGLSRITVSDTEDGSYVIFFGVDEEIEQFAKLTDASSPVQEMVQKVSSRMEEALAVDADLRALNEKMTRESQTEE